MENFDIDFHIHSKYSGGTSSNMELPLIAKNSELKGINVIGTGDALHELWLKHIEKNLTEEKDGIYGIEDSKTKFLITTEVEDNHRVHHLILFPSISSAKDLREALKKYSLDIDKDGRPHLRLNGNEIADHVKDVGALIGPSHAFTPWTAVYKEYDSLKDCYGDRIKDIHFLELGLSADSNMADRISELKDITFMSNSDCHSPSPHRLGREFNRLAIKELSFEEIKKAIERCNGRKFILNIGLDPREGKYHITACSRCYIKFKLEDAVRLKWRCPECKGSIKKGVSDRINELSNHETKHPEHRPKYIHMAPLAEIISLAKGISTLSSRKVQILWEKFIKEMKTEINVLIDSDINSIKKIDPEVGDLIKKFREDKIQYIAGGGGHYGRPTLKNEREILWGQGQKLLGDY